MHEGGLDALLMLVESSQNTTILRVASGAIANLAMNGTRKYTLISIFSSLNSYFYSMVKYAKILCFNTPNKHTLLLHSSAMNQGLITNKGGAKLLASAASKTDDPQTLRMIAGAIANLCGNGKLFPGQIYMKVVYFCIVEAFSIMD